MSKTKIKNIPKGKKEHKPEDKLLEKALKVLEDKKAEDIRIFNVQELVDYADYFIFCSGTSSTHLKTLADELQKKIKKENINIKQSGDKNSGWIILDCGMVVCHCMGQAERAFYKLEDLWKDADVVYHHY